MKKNDAYRTAIVFLLADTLYSLLFDLTASLGAQGKEMKRETKMRFNQMVNDLNTAKKSCLRATSDVSIGVMDDYIDSSDFLREVVEVVYEKTLRNEENERKIKEFLAGLENDSETVERIGGENRNLLGKN